jgi:hypothetical protein
MFKKILFCCLIGFSNLGHAQTDAKPFNVWANLGFGLNLLSVGSLSDTSFQFQPEIAGAYYFTPNVGVFTGLGWTKYEIESSSDLVTDISFLDIPFGFSFKYGRSFIPDASSMFNLGMFVGVPLSDLELDGVSIADAETPFGLYIGSVTSFPVSEALNLGFGTSVKFPFGDVVDTPSNQALSIAFNFVLMY